MPDIILPNLGLELPDIGSDQDTWGDILNANLEILDNAVTYDAITKTLGAVDVTLTTAEAAHGVINLNGTLTANVNLIVPVSPVRLYLVNNGTTGAFTVAVKTAAGSGVTVNQGANTLVYSDGTNIVQGATSVNGSFAAGTVNAGTLNVSNNAIITGGLSAGAATLITTGNRIAVFGASSVFSANPASPGTLDNVVIGGTTRLAGSFTTLSASGATTLNGAVTLGDAAADAITVTGTATFTQATQFPDGTAALPSITNTGDTNTGRFYPAEDTIAESVGGIEALRIISSRYFKASNTGTYTGSAILSASALSHVFQHNQNDVVLAGIGTNTGSSVRCIFADLPSGATGYLFSGFTNNSEVYRVLANGTVQNSTGLYQSISDRRVKNNIQTLTGSGAFIDALQPRTWEWAEGSMRSGTGAGFIADEFQQVCPEAVTGDANAVDEDGKPIYQAIDPSTAEVIANLVAEIQSLRQRLAALEAK